MAYGIQGAFMDPRATASHFHLHEGDIVADFGAGTGSYLKILSELVGTSGCVYACEIQKSHVDEMNTFIKKERLSNVRPLWCDLEAVHGTKLGDGVLDAGILVNTLFQIEEKEKALQEIARVMHKGAKLILIDWTDSFGGMGPLATEVFTKEKAQTLLTRSGFEYVRDFPAGDHHYGLAFRRV